MKHLEINTKDLLEWKNKQTVLYASSSVEKKQLHITLYGNYEIFKNNVKVFDTDQTDKAVDYYNSI